jgi:tetratricopeptide (TPR) repeat protein
MTDSLITRLSLVRGLSVRPWASVQLYIRSEKDPVTLGRELRVESVVDGTLQRAGDRIRVTARLYRVDDGKLLWAEKFDEPYRDLLAVQDSISEKVAAALSLRLSRQPQPRVDPEAYEAYVRGRYFFELFTKEGNQRAKEYFERAIELEPDFALAHAGLALNYGPMRVRGFIGPLEHLEEHRDAAERALTLDDSLAEAHLAMFTFRLDTRDWQGAERSVKRAIELNPNYLHAWGFYAFLLHGLGRHEEGLAASQRALEIDPVSDYASKDLGNSLVRVGRYQEALEQAKKAVELRPDFAPAHQVLASAYAALNQLEDAYRHFQIAGDQVSAARIRARQGDMGPVRDLIEALEPRNAWMALAPLYLAMGDKERALSALESAYEAQSPMMHVAVDSRFQPLHGDPRFERVVSRLRLSTGD